MPGMATRRQPFQQARWLVAIILLFPCLGCASVSSATYPGAALSPTDSSSIAIYYNAPPVPYDVIGEVQYQGAPAAQWSGAEKLLREKAAKMGGDAVIVQEKDRPIRGAMVSGSMIGLAREKVMRGIVIKYRQ